MKTKLLAASIAILSSAAANADMFLGATGGINYKLNDFTNESSEGAQLDLEKSNNYDLYLNFEHMLPLVPNVRGELEMAESGNNPTGSEMDYNRTSIYGYYEVLDGLGWMHLDVGAGLSDYTGDLTHLGTNYKINETLPTYFANAKFNVPISNVFAGAETRVGSNGDMSSSSAYVFVGLDVFSVVLGTVSTKFGYKTEDLRMKEGDLTEFDMGSSGYVFTVELDI